MNAHCALYHSKQFPFTQLPQNAIDMDGGQAQRVGKNELAERAFELGLGRQSDQAQPFSQFHEEMRCSLDGVAPPDEEPALEPANDVVFSLGAQGAGTFQKTSK